MFLNAHVASWLFIVKPAVMSSGFQVDVPLGYCDVTETELEETEVQMKFLTFTKYQISNQTTVCVCVWDITVFSVQHLYQTVDFTLCVPIRLQRCWEVYDCWPIRFKYRCKRFMTVNQSDSCLVTDRAARVLVRAVLKWECDLEWPLIISFSFIKKKTNFTAH